MSIYRVEPELKRTCPEDARSQPNDQDGDYWSRLISRVPKPGSNGFPPLPRRANKTSILDGMMKFIRKRELTRSVDSLNAYSTFAATVRSQEVNNPVNIQKKDVSTMTTFEPSFLESLGRTVKSEAVEDEEVVPNSQPLDFSQELDTDQEDDIKIEVDDFMRDVLNRTDEKLKIVKMEEMDPFFDNLVGNNECGNGDFGRFGGVPVKIEERSPAPAAAIQRPPCISNFFQGVVSTEVKSRPYVTSVIGEASQRTKLVQNILYQKTSEVLNPRSNVDKTPAVRSEKDAIVDKIMSGVMGTKKRKKNVISGVDLRRHPEPKVLAEESLSQQPQQRIRISLENDDEVRFTKPRPPKPMSPGTVRLQLGLEPKKENRTATPALSGSRKRSID